MNIYRNNMLLTIVDSCQNCGALFNFALEFEKIDAQKLNASLVRTDVRKDAHTRMHCMN